MYVRTLERRGFGLGQPKPSPKLQQPLLRKKFTSNVVVYKDSSDKCQATNSAIYVPKALRDPSEMDVLVFFHGLLDVCDSEHKFDPDRLIDRFRLDLQVDGDPQLALAVPIVPWNKQDRVSGIIRTAWSAAYLNGYVEEVLDQIGNSYGVRPKLGRLIIAGHSAAYEILTPLAQQFYCGVAEIGKGPLAKLDRVISMDACYRTQDAKAFELWAGSLERTKFILVFSKADPSPSVWQDWERMRKKVTGNEKRPTNLRVFQHMAFKHCQLPGSFLGTYLYS